MSQPIAHHTGITVSDLDSAIEFYTQLLDCTVETRFTVSGKALGTAVKSDGVTGSFAHLDSGGTRIELVEYEPSSAPRARASLTQPGATHVAFSVDDVDAFVDDLSEEIERLSEPQTTESGTRIVFVRDPDGNLVELLEA